jgi:hypothetical protein
MPRVPHTTIFRVGVLVMNDLNVTYFRYTTTTFCSTSSNVTRRPV